MQNFHENRTKEDDGEHRRGGGTKVLSRTTIANLGKTRTNTSLKVDHSKDKELINNGLHKLVSSFNTAKIGNRPSKTVSKKSSDHKSDLHEKQVNSHIVLTKQVSIDKYTMTDFDQNERKLEIESTVLNEQPPYRDLQWTDPRLLKKYSLTKQPFKKSLTIPYVNKSEAGTEITETLSEDNAELLYNENTHFMFKCLYYFCTASVSFIGSMCGITLITVVLWKMLDENLLTFYLTAPRNDFIARGFVRGLFGSIFSMFGSIFGKIMRLLTISTSEALARDNSEVSPNSWYS